MPVVNEIIINRAIRLDPGLRFLHEPGPEISALKFRAVTTNLLYLGKIRQWSPIMEFLRGAFESRSRGGGGLLMTMGCP